MRELCEYPGLTTNSNAPFCFDHMECVDFLGPGSYSSLLKQNFKVYFFLHLNIVFDMVIATISFFPHFLGDEVIFRHEMFSLFAGVEKV